MCLEINRVRWIVLILWIKNSWYKVFILIWKKIIEFIELGIIWLYLSFWKLNCILSLVIFNVERKV